MPLFTKENAREMAIKANHVRWHSNPVADHAANIAGIADQMPDYALLRLSRVRAQLDRVDAMAAEETDPKRIREYADATSRLQEQERQLAGRPLPGTLKPSARSSVQRPAVTAPTLPVVVATTNPGPTDPQST